MIKKYKEKSTNGCLVMHISDGMFFGRGLTNPDITPVNTFVFNKGRAQSVRIDEITYTFPENSILPLIAKQHFVFEMPENVVAWEFNQEFYCMLDHDVELGCVGFLFYGIDHPMFIRLNHDQVADLSYIEKSFSQELSTKDNFQGEMLRTLLKKTIITLTRIAKRQNKKYERLPNDKMDAIRKFGLMLELNFKTEHEVRFYAAALNKSPKTLSNLFTQLGQPAPSRLIRNRLVLEAKRYLYYTDKSAKEIAYALGFESLPHFSRFFKQNVGVTVSEFKKSINTERAGGKFFSL